MNRNKAIVIRNDKYQVQIDRLNYLIHAQEITVRLRQHDFISAEEFLEQWTCYERTIRYLLDFMSRKGFIVLRPRSANMLDVLQAASG
jgi:hypothetical protein